MHETSTRASDHNRPGARARPLALLPVALAVAALLCAVWSLAERRAPRHAPGSAREARPAVELARALVPPASEPSSGARRTPAALGAAQAAPAAEPAPATISGRLQVDGLAPSRGRVRILDEERGWEFAAAIDRHGRFFVEGVPSSKLALSLEMESEMEFEGRRLLLPTVELEPVPGTIAFVDLDWKTRHLNVQVLDGGEPSSPARVDIEGPGYSTRIDTNERGRAKLGLVGNGSFSFRTSLPSGRRGDVTVELEPDGELETVVLATTLAPR